MGNVEIITGIMAFLGLFKIIYIYVDQKNYHKKIVKPFYKGNVKNRSYLFLILAFVVLGFLLQEMNVVEIFAAMAFFGFLIGFSFLQFQKELGNFVDKIYGKKFEGVMHIYMLIWAALSLWVLYLVLM